MQTRPLNLRSLIAIVNKVYLIYFTAEIYQTTSMTIGLNNVI